MRAMVVTTIRPDTVFVPYHWAGRKSINQLTIAAQDPISKIPEYKVCAVRVKKAAGNFVHANVAFWTNMGRSMNNIARTAVLRVPPKWRANTAAGRNVRLPRNVVAS